MDKNFDINNVADDIRNFLNRYPPIVNKIGIFGSLARGDYNNNSDIDILIEYKKSNIFDMKLFIEFCDLCNKLSESLAYAYGRSIDIVHFENNQAVTLSNDIIEKEIYWL
jgi:predicted nucleotidyltransferase